MTTRRTPIILSRGRRGVAGASVVGPAGTGGGTFSDIIVCAKDAVTEYVFPDGVIFGNIAIVFGDDTFQQINVSGHARIDAGNSPAILKVDELSASVFVAAVGTPTGTTGADGSLGIYVATHTLDRGRIFIENRTQFNPGTFKVTVW